MRLLIRHYAVMALFAAVVHFLASTFAAFVVSHSYDGRMPNVRKFETEPKARQGLIAAYLRDAADDDRPTTCFIGSSFTWGHPFTERGAFSAAAGEAMADGKTINASVVGAGLEVSRNTLKVAQELDVRFARIVVEIPIVNELEYLERGCSWKAHCLPTRPEPFTRVVSYPTSYLEWFLTFPGSWTFATEDRGETSEDAAHDEVVLNKLRPDYFMNHERFSAVREAYGRSIAETLAEAAKVADEVVAFPSPIYVRGARSLGFDEESLREQVGFTVEACRRSKGVIVVPLEERHLSDPYFFDNVTHFHPRGSREFGKWLVSRIESAGETLPVAAESDGAVTRH